MKKNIMAGILVLVLALFAAINLQSADAYQIKADARTKKVPMGTKLAGDMFSAYLTNDVMKDGDVVLPRGTIIRGNSAKVTKPKMLSRSAVLYLNFDHIVAPNGKQIPLRAGISSALKLTQDGGIDGGGGYGEALVENLDKSGEIIKKSTNWGLKSGEELFTGGKYLVTPIAAVGGTIAGVGYLVGDSVMDLFRKGKNVIILKGQRFEILLLESIDVPLF